MRLNRKEEMFLNKLELLAKKKHFGINSLGNFRVNKLINESHKSIFKNL